MQPPSGPAELLRAASKLRRRWSSSGSHMIMAGISTPSSCRWQSHVAAAGYQALNLGSEGLPLPPPVQLRLLLVVIVLRRRAPPRQRAHARLCACRNRHACQQRSGRGGGTCASSPQLAHSASQSSPSHQGDPQRRQGILGQK